MKKKVPDSKSKPDEETIRNMRFRYFELYDADEIVNEFKKSEQA